MDYFSLCLNIFCIAALGVMHISFCNRLTGKKQRIWHFAAYISLLYILEWFAGRFSFPWFISIGAELLILYGINHFIMGSRSSASWTAAVLAAYISQLSFGIINSAESLLFPYIVGRKLLYFLVIAATAASFAICAACYVIILKSISPTEIEQSANAGCLLFPVLFFFASESYIMQTSYTYVQSFYNELSYVFLLENMGKHTALLSLQTLGLGSLLCTLYAYRHLCHSLHTQEKIRSMAQAAQAQKVYIAEAQTRYEQTKAFRHDIKNHLSVLDGLLDQGKLDEGKAYLQRLEAASSILSFPYQTGNPVVDILLAEKLGLAKEQGISAEASLCFPKTCRTDDFDLCVIFANALDNAVRACQETEGPKSIYISGEQQGCFYMLTFKNTCSNGEMPPEGTGLSNIRSVAEKYHGAVLTEKTGSFFSLNVLLNISLHPESISFQKP